MRGRLRLPEHEQEAQEAPDIAQTVRRNLGSGHGFLSAGTWNQKRCCDEQWQQKPGSIVSLAFCRHPKLTNKHPPRPESSQILFFLLKKNKKWKSKLERLIQEVDPKP
jgi:hypothetical protein